MRVFRYQSPTGPRLGVETASGRFELTNTASGVFRSIGTWLSQPDPVGLVRAAVERVGEPLVGGIALLPPIDYQEVWAAGVTYERSKVARQEESQAAGGGDFYDRVYSAERPEIFFKSAGWRVVGTGGAIRIRRDSHWNVPEPEMTLVLSSGGAIVGITIGNDMSSRSIEGENPLYLPQAKTYDGCCALGPAILIIEDPALLRNRAITMEIFRDEASVWSNETSTARMHRTPEDLAGYLFRELSFPTGAFLMTGTGIVPADTFTLQSGDRVSITIDGVGTLTNTVA